MDNVIAIILAGGAGTRLRPLTEHRSKPAVPLLGKYRLVDVPISNCLNAGIHRVLVLTQFNAASLNHHITETYRFDGFSDGFVSVLAAEQTPSSSDWYRGTADAVRQVLHHLERYAHSHVLVLSGDQIYQMDYSDMLRHHLQFDADISVATVPVDAGDAARFGIIKSNESHRISRFREKPLPRELTYFVDGFSEERKENAKIYQASTGIYLFDRSVIKKILIENPHFLDFGKEAIPHALEVYNVISYPFESYWTDVGSIGAYFDANMMLLDQAGPIDLYEGPGKLYTQLQVLPPARIYNSSINEAVIAEGSRIYDSKIDRSVLGPQSYVGSNSVVRDTIIMGATYFPEARSPQISPSKGARRPGIGENCYIEKAILDVNAGIGDGCIIKNEENIQEAEGPGYYIRDGIVVIPQEVEIPPRTIVVHRSNTRRNMIEPIPFDIKRHTRALIYH